MLPIYDYVTYTKDKHCPGKKADTCYCNRTRLSHFCNYFSSHVGRGKLISFNWYILIMCWTWFEICSQICPRAYYTRPFKVAS